MFIMSLFLGVCWLHDLLKGLVKVPFFLRVTIFKGGNGVGVSYVWAYHYPKGTCSFFDG